MSNVTPGQWVLLSMGGEPPLSGSEITLELGPGDFGGNAGVNRFSGKLNDHQIVAPIATTMMAGPADLMDQERRFLAVLEGSDRLIAEDDRLFLKSGDERMAVFGRVEFDLVGINWVLAALNNGTGGFETAVAGTEVTAVFDEEGRVFGFGGCNRYKAGYQIDDNRISISQLGSTRMACPDESLMSQEKRFLELLEETDSIEFRRGHGRDMLELFSDGGLRLVQFVASEAVGTKNFDATSNKISEIRGSQNGSHMS